VTECASAAHRDTNSTVSFTEQSANGEKKCRARWRFEYPTEAKLPGIERGHFPMNAPATRVSRNGTNRFVSKSTRRTKKLLFEILEDRCLLSAVTFESVIPDSASNTVLKAKDKGPIVVDVPQAPANAKVTIALQNNPGAMTLNGTVTQSVVNGKATFTDLFINGGTPTKGFTFVAFSPGYDPAVSNTFSVKPGSAYLNIESKIGDAVAGQLLKDTTTPIGTFNIITVQVLEVDGSTNDAATGMVNLFIDKNPGGAQFVDDNGQPTVIKPAAVEHGLAIFDDVRLDKAGSGYTLGAFLTGGPPVLSAASNSFAITPAAAAGVTFQVATPEVTSTDLGLSTTSKYSPLSQAPVLAGTAHGTVYAGTTPVQTFIVSTTGTFTFTDIGATAPAHAVPTGSQIDLATGVITLAWNKPAGVNHLLVSYSSDPAVPLATTKNPINMVGRKPPFIQGGVMVSVVDKFGNFVGTDSAASVTVAIGANPGGSTLGGLTTVTASSGVAFFNSLTLDKAGQNYSLKATAKEASADLTPAVSNLFNVADIDQNGVQLKVLPIAAGSVTGETTSTEPGGLVTTSYSPLQHVPFLAGSLTGSVFVGATKIQTFAVDTKGVFTFTDIGTPAAKAISAGSKVDPVTGTIVLAWNAPAGRNHLEVSYQYLVNIPGQTSTDPGTTTTAVYAPLAVVPIRAGTLTGTVFVGTTAIQTFTVDASGAFTFTDIGTPATNRAVSTGSSVDLATGIITVAWNNPAGPNHLDVNYFFTAGSDETPGYDPGLPVFSKFLPLAHTPLLPATLTGDVFVGTTKIQTFTVGANGVFTFTDVGSPAPVRAVSAGSAVSPSTGQIILAWSGPIGANHLVVNYQYNTSAVPVFGKVPTLQVEIDDASGQKVASDNSSQVSVQTGNIFGTLTETAVNGVVTFDNLYFGSSIITTGNQNFTIQFGFTELARSPANSPTLALVPGKPDHLFLENGAVNNYTAGGTTGKDFLTSGSNPTTPIMVDVKDKAGNTVPVNGYVIAAAIKQVAPNSLATLIGMGPDPLDATTLGLFQNVVTVNGVATFSQLYIHQQGVQYQLSIGTSDFANNTDTSSSKFDVNAGVATKLSLVVPPANQPLTNPPTIRVGSLIKIPGGPGLLATNQFTVGVTDAVGNLIASNNGTSITMTMPVIPPDGAGSTLQSGETNGLTKTTVNGIAIFDSLYINQTVGHDVPGYQLQATATASGLAASPLTNPITVAAPPNTLVPDSFVLNQGPPPVTQPVQENQTIPLKYTVTNSTTPTSYVGKVTVTVYLVDAVTGLPTSIQSFGLNGTPSSAVISSADNSITFSNLSVSVPGTYRIRASTDLGALINVSDPFKVVAPPTVATPTPPAAPPLAALPDPKAVQVGLGSYFQNFNYYQSLPVYPTIPGNNPPSSDTTPPVMVQPNVTPPVFDSKNPNTPLYPYFTQVPDSSKWWSSLMFQRSKVKLPTSVPSDSNGNQLWPMFADPFAMMINSNSGQSTPINAYDFAGIGLTHLTHLFVNPAPQFLDQKNTQPNALYPGNNAFLYSYGGFKTPDQRLYQDMSVGLASMQGNATVLSYSDWGATFNWSDSAGVPKLQATLGEGLPYAYFNASNVDPSAGTAMQIVMGNPNWLNVNITATPYDPKTGQLSPTAEKKGALLLSISYDVVEFTAPGDVTPITIQMRNNYGIFLPPDVSWALSTPSGGIQKLTFKMTPTSNYFTVATLPDATVNTFNLYRQHGYAFVTNTTVNFTYSDATALLTTTYAVRTMQMPGVGADLVNSPLQALYVTQYDILAPNTPLTSYTYNSVRGPMKVFDGGVFVTVLQHHGTLPEVPPVPDGSQADLFHNYLYPYLLSFSKGGSTDGSLDIGGLLPDQTNSYSDAQSMLGAAQLIPILQEISNSADPGLSESDRQLAALLAQKIFQIVKDHMSGWLSATDDQAPYMLYYQPKKLQEANPPAGQGWQALLAVQGFSLAPESINDQNLITGYFLKTASILAQYDPYWSNSELLINNGSGTLPSKYGDLIDMMINNVADFDRRDTMFPFLRSMDVYQGHSWADGAGNNESGTNQESSSESLDFASALIQWGEITGDNSIRDQGIFLYDTESHAVNTYYFDVDPTTGAFPDAFRLVDTPAGQVDNRPMLPFLKSASSNMGGFVGDVPLRYVGIQTIPLSGGSYYLGQSASFVQKVFDFAMTGTTPVGQPPLQTPKYLSLIYPYLALANPDQAMTLYKDSVARGQMSAVNYGQPIDTDAFNIHWITTLQQYGQVDMSFHADTPSFQVFSKTQGDKTTSTFVAYNPDPLPKLVHFFDNAGNDVFDMMVPGRTEQTSNFSKSQVVAQTSPDYSITTPTNRFFFSSTQANGAFTLLNQTTGTGAQKVTIPAASSKNSIQFVVKGVSGTLKSSDAVEDFVIYADPGLLGANDVFPGVLVSVTYANNGGTGTPLTLNFTRNPIGPNTGFVERDSSVGYTGNLAAHFQTLTNATITITISLDAGSTSAFFRTDAVGEQGKVSYFDLPYNITAVGGQPVGQNPNVHPSVVPGAAGSQTPSTPGGSGPAAPVHPDPSGHTYTATLSGKTATFTGDAASDALVFTVAADGNLEHNRFGTDPGFASPEDFDSTVPGVQTLAAATTSSVIINTGTGTETITLGTPDSPASTLLARFVINNGAVGASNQDVLAIDDSTNAQRVVYSVSAGVITSADNNISVQLNGPVMGGGITLTTGIKKNLVKVVATRAGETLNVTSVQGLDDVQIGAGTLQNILGDVHVTNEQAFSNIIVDNSQAADFSTDVVISPNSITGMAKATIFYNPADVNDLEIEGGTSAGTYRVTGSISGTFIGLTLHAQDTLIVGNNGVIDDDSFPDALFLTGNLDNGLLRFDNSAGAAKTLTANASAITGLTSTGIEFNDFKNVALDLGKSGNQISVAGDVPGDVVAYTFTGTSGGDSVTVLAPGGGLVGDVNVHFTGGAGAQPNTLTFDANGASVRAVPGGISSGDSDVQSVTYDQVQSTTLANAGGVNTFYGPNTADRAQALTGLTAQERFVQVLYLDSLGRAGAKTELDFWVGALNGQGGSQGGVAKLIENSQEARTHLVDSWYQTYLGRAAGAGEAQPWVTLLASGQSEEGVLKQILATPEFYARAQTLVGSGTADERFVQTLYKLLLNRSGSSNDVAFWTNALPALGREGVVADFLASTEFHTNLIAAVYAALLHRPGDPAGDAFWMSQSLNANALRIGFEGTPEFFQNG
jgi:hypothetical protein